MRRSLRILFLLVWALPVGCTPPGDDDARAAAVERIVSLSPALTEILFALELGDRVVGVTEYCDWPAAAREKPRIGGYVNPSVEAVVAAQPDLVVVSPNTGNRDAVLALERTGLRVAIVAAEDLSDTFAAIREVARLAGVADRGESLASSLERRIDRAATRARERAPVDTLYCLQLEPIIAAGSGTLPGELLELAGGRNVIDAAGYPRLGVETVVQAEPAVILQARMDDPDPDNDARLRHFWSRWPAIPAVREGRLHVFDGSSSLRPGPRVAEAVEQLAALLDPEDGG